MGVGNPNLWTESFVEVSISQADRPSALAAWLGVPEKAWSTGCSKCSEAAAQDLACLIMTFLMIIRAGPKRAPTSSLCGAKSAKSTLYIANSCYPRVLGGSIKPGCFKHECLQFLRGSALLRAFAPFCALLRTSICAHLRSSALICVFLRTTTFVGSGRNTVSRVLFRRRELTEFWGKLGEFCEELGEFAFTHK